MKKNKGFQIRFLSLMVAALCAGAAHGQIAPGALPLGGTVVGGQASIVQNGATLNINQTSNQALVNFSSFNVGSAALVDIRQPGAAAALLARVTGQDPSQIYGQIRANGSLWLINPSGIMVGQSARIDVGSFIASTLNLSDADFLAGRLTFTSPGGAGAISNAGSINTASGGRIYLVAPTIQNSGTLSAPKGEVLLAAAQNVQLVDTGSPGVSIALSGAAGHVKNMGRILAEAGRIGLGGALVTNAGEISASSAVSEGGRVFLRANDLKTTEASSISANGTAGGNVLLAADHAAIDGRVSATGSAGPGGFVDTSGHLRLAVKHAPTVGKGGTWLIDPSNLEVVSGGGGDASVEPGVITSNESGTTIGADVISAQLNGGASVVLATGNGGTGAGNITVSAAIAKTDGEGASLTLRAHNNIVIDAPISSQSGALDVNLNSNFYGNPTDAGHAAQLNADLSLNGGRLNLAQGEAIGNGTLNIGGGMTTLANGSSIQAAAVHVQERGRVWVDSAQNLQGAWTNDGRIDVVNAGSISVTSPAASLVNNGSIGLSGSNAMGLTGSTDTPNLINNGVITKTDAGAKDIVGLTNGATGRLEVGAGRVSLDRSTVGGHVTVSAGADLVVKDSALGGGVDIAGAGTMMWSGNVTLLGDVTLGAAAPTLRDDPDRFFTFIKGSGYTLTTYGLVNVVKNLVLDSGSTWENFGTVTVGPTAPGVLAFNLNTVFDNKAGGVLNVTDGSRLELTNQTVINNEWGARLQVASSGTSAFSGGYQGTLNNSGTVVKTGEGSTLAPLRNLAGGVLQIDEGAFGVVFSQDNPNAGTVDIAAGATLRSTSGVDLYNVGMIRGIGSVDLGDSGRVVNNGIVAPGSPDRIGTLSVMGGYMQGPAGALNIRLANDGTDRLDVAGSVQLGGTLNLSNRNGVQPNGTSADFLTANNVGSTGNFATVNGTSVVTPETTSFLSVVYPAVGIAVAQVRATTVPTLVVAPPGVPPVATPVAPPVVLQPISTAPAPIVTTAPSPVSSSTQPSADICTIAPNSALCQVLSPPTASDPVKPVQQASSELIKTVTASIPAALPTKAASSLDDSATSDKTATTPSRIKNYCN